MSSFRVASSKNGDNSSALSPRLTVEFQLDNVREVCIFFIYFFILRAIIAIAKLYLFGKKIIHMFQNTNMISCIFVFVYKLIF